MDCIKSGHYFKQEKMHKRVEIKKYLTDRLKDYSKEEIDKLKEDNELHNEIFNTDYYVVGTYEAKKWLGDKAFDIIGEIKEYEIDNFGEVNTDLADPEKVVNMYVYIVGEELINEML